MSLYSDLFADLSLGGVRYVVVGGVAVVLQGVARLTADIDLVLDLETANVRSAIHVLTARGLRPMIPVDPMDFADEAKRDQWIEQKNMTVFSMRDEANPLITVDLFAREPIPFSELWQRSDVIRLGNTEVHVASIPDLIAMKKAAARVQDLADIEKLNRVLRERER